MCESLINVDDPRVPIAKGTCYNWHSKNKYPGLIFKVCGKLMFDMKVWNILAAEAKAKSIGDGND